MHAADVRCHLDCWLVQACLPRAIETKKYYFSDLLQVQHTAQMVRYCYNKSVCWSGASVSDMHTCRHKFTE